MSFFTNALSNLITPHIPEDHRDSLKERVVMPILSLLEAFIVALFIRTFFYQPFIIPSESMYPTLVVGDFIFVNKYVYGFSNQSFPLAPPLMNGRIWVQSLPKRGDVVVFHNDKHTDENNISQPLDYIKRLVGLPGDKIQMIQGVLHINEKPVSLKKIDDYHMVDAKGRFHVLSQYEETFPDGITHPILKGRPLGQGWLDNTEEFTVPEGHYFMMGDNRDNSKDSRVMSAVGFIPFHRVIGRADLVLLSHLGTLLKPWTWLNLRFDRFPHLIR